MFGIDWLAALFPVLLCACTGASPPACPPAARPAPVAWVISQDWHTEIGLPASELSGRLASFRTVFPGASALVFGFGKRTWMTARVESPAELLMGPFPGPAVIEVVGLRVEPALAFGGSEVIRLKLRPGQLARLSDFLWDSFGKAQVGGKAQPGGKAQAGGKARAGEDGAVGPRLVSQGLFPGSLFYAASRGYGPLHTCNSWTAEALGAAGLPVRARGVVFAGGVLDQVARLGQACRMQAAPR